MPGITDSAIEWDNEIPVAITLELRGGQTIRVDFVQQSAVQTTGKPLKEKQREWCLQMADYLMRQALLKRQDEKRQEGSDGAKPLEFYAKIDPNVTWWG
ncbi:hypothetical protein [Magnetofaba australis]|uniref:Uncharacterized protein n=1 Tax=Magnetofaba australis IT-1 TaxID=1434232 RepID=A0A1Y2K232_9PROT|nr:hypothetical protein [Magnetofaba australis]OSM00381.1 hypothetical protein MAIT1_00887 [Magnetofaba australis IT-1]